MTTPRPGELEVREEFAILGDEVPLIGTVATTERAGDTAVVLLNAGLVSRAGPDGLHVRLARAFAARGYPTLRFDCSGVGDSPPRRDRIPIHDARVLETRSALDWLQDSLRIDRFVLMGICTGADNAFECALSDERVRGLVLLDGYPYRTLGWWIRHYAPRALRASSWRTLIRHRVGAPRPPAEAARPGWAGVARRIPTRSQMAEQLGTLIERGVHLYFVYTGGFSDWVNHAGQLRAALRRVRFRARVQVDYLPGADHVFRPVASQRSLGSRVEAWLAERFPVA